MKVAEMSTVLFGLGREEVSVLSLRGACTDCSDNRGPCSEL